MKRLLCMLSCTATMAYAQQEKPNVIVILVDDMGIGDVSTYGPSTVPTPNLDRFAQEGLQINNFYSAAPVSSPARAGITTGRYPIKYQMNTFLDTRAANKRVENADYLFNVVFVITIISLLVQGTTVSGMANWLNLSFTEKERTFKLVVPDHIKSEFSEIEINNAMLKRGNTLRDIQLPGHTLVVMVFRSGEYFVPKGDTILSKGDKLLVVSDNNDELIKKVTEMGVENIIKM